MEKYQHRPIDLATDAIRLVRLRKGSPEDPIRCDLFDSFLHESECIPYEALSYAWGSISNPEEIVVDGVKTLAITSNLHTALHYLRLGDQDRILWIDAICINQKDMKEKGHQVGQMRSVYENAEKVLIWLGLGNANVDHVMDLMNRLDKQVISLGYNSINSSKSWEMMQNLLLKQYGRTDHDLRRSALRMLLEKPWFRRVWVVQEVASARRAVVVCGWRSVSTRTFCLMPFALEMQIDKRIQAVLEIMPGSLRGASWWAEKRDLRTILKKFGDSEATDPRDNIYALFGISSNTRDNSILQPDYDATLKRVIRDTVSFLLFNKILDETYVFPDWNFIDLQFALDHLDNTVIGWAIGNNNSLLARLWYALPKEVDTMPLDHYMSNHVAGEAQVLGIMERGHIDFNIEDLNNKLLRIAVRGDIRQSWTSLWGAQRI
ncbi:Heterokaryon incompatibility 6-like protein [Cladobotryum mycophilum]|uniref:Heterokaryon incompatibility 6-like protein n=1 Tax=Cladobotryum mycophilum TaxID=491253 RepID=A0ABR0SYK1_9HYPO